MRVLIQSAVQTLTLNNTTYSGPTINLNLESDETIDVNSIENGLKISLNSDLTDKIRSGVQSFTINGEKLTGNDLVYDIEGSDTITIESTGGKSSISLNSDYTNRVDSAIQTIELNGEILNKENNKYSIEGSDSIDVTATAGKSVVTLNETLKNKIQQSAQTLTINGVEFDGPQFEFDIISGNAVSEDGTVRVSNTIDVKQEGSQLTLSHYTTDFVPIYEEAASLKIIDKDSTPIVLTTLSRDNLGHVRSYGVSKLSFSKIFDYIDALEKRIEALENK
jgi:hypothetical protein